MSGKGIEFILGIYENVLESDNGDSIQLWIYSKPLNYIL